MKRVVQIAASIILSCLFFTQEGFAQNKKLNEANNNLKLPSYLYKCNGSARLYEGYEVNLTYKYYYDDNYNRIMEGPMKVSGQFEDYFGMTSIHTVCTANVNIIGNTANGDLNGAMSATYNEQVKGSLANESYALTLKTTFKDNLMVGTLTMDSSLNIEGKKQKQWWHITLDTNGNPKTVDCQEYGMRIKASYNDKGEATGEIVNDGKTLKFTRNLAMSVFKTETGDLSTCGAVQKALLDKYIKGVYNEDDLLREGYILSSHKSTSVIFDENALRCLNLRRSNLGKFNSIYISVKVLEKVDVLKCEELVAYVDSIKLNSAFNWKDLKYDESGRRLYLDDSWYYAMKSEFDRFEHVVDSIARVESQEFADFLFASQWDDKIYKSDVFLGRGFDLHLDARNYRELVGLGNSSFKLENLVRNQVYKNERVYNLHGVVTYDKGQNHGLYKKKVVLAVTATDRSWWVEVVNAENIPTEWDKYRELKDKVIKQHEAIVSNPAQYDQPSYMSYITFCQGCDLNASEDYEQSMKVLNNLDLVIKSFLEYTKKREKLLIDNSKLIDRLYTYGDILPFYKKFFASLQYTWTPNEGLDVLSTPRKTIDKTRIFLLKRESIDANNAKLKGLSSAAITLGSIYDQWRQTADLKWTPDIDCEKLDAVIGIQNACIEILSRPDIKEIDKRIKRSKLTDLRAVIQFVNSGYESAPNANKAETRLKDNSAEIENPKKEAVVKKVKEEKVKEVKVKETKVREYRNKGLINSLQFNMQRSLSNMTSNIIGGDYMIGYRFSHKFTLSAGVGFSLLMTDTSHDVHNYVQEINSGASSPLFNGTWIKEVRNQSDYSSKIFLPVYLNAKYYFTKGGVQPFISASAGVYVLPLIFPKTEVGVGCNFRFANRLNAYLLLSLDTAVSPCKSFVQNYPEPYIVDLDVRDKADFFTPSIKVGFTF